MTSEREGTKLLTSYQKCVAYNLKGQCHEMNIFLKI